MSELKDKTFLIIFDGEGADIIPPITGLRPVAEFLYDAVVRFEIEGIATKEEHIQEWIDILSDTDEWTTGETGAPFLYSQALGMDGITTMNLYVLDGTSFANQENRDDAV